MNLTFLYFVYVFVALVAVCFYFYIRDQQLNKDEVKLGSGEMFDSIAPYYDTANTLMSLGFHKTWRKEVAKYVLLSISSKEKYDPTSSSNTILDLATGTGDLAITIYEEIGHKAKISILGIDPSISMLKIAERKIIAKGLFGKVSLHVGRAQSLEEEVMAEID
jgi:demethylmenaquinone methyltransferase/2-methoxy-6-polyprenyl-1,4-benzoquinol methylase